MSQIHNTDAKHILLANISALARSGAAIKFLLFGFQAPVSVPLLLLLSHHSQQEGEEEEGQGEEGPPVPEEFRRRRQERLSQERFRWRASSVAAIGAREQCSGNRRTHNPTGGMVMETVYWLLGEINRFLQNYRLSRQAKGSIYNQHLF
jgi:hypothetical protein